jgi:flagellin-like hook-associated protein FlgL
VDQIGDITTNPDGSKSYLARITRTVSAQEIKYLSRSDGLYYKGTLDNGLEGFILSNTDDVFVYQNNYDPEDPDLLRDVNHAVYAKADSANDGVQRYVVKKGASEVQLDKTYKLCHYEYKLLNNAGNEIMTGRSDSFVDTGEDTDILDSIDDAVKDQQMGIKRTDDEGRYILKQRAENIDDSIELLLKGTNPSGEEYYYSATKQTDQSIRNIVFTGINIDNQTSTITIQYNDHEDTDGNRNKSVGGTVNPNGSAYRDFSKPARTAGIAREQNFRIKMNPPEKLLHIQSGAKGWQSIDIRYPALTNAIIGIGTSGVKTWGQASSAISEMDEAIEMISRVRSTFGVYHNRLEYSYAIDQNTSENTQAAESRIRDTDMAKEMVSFSKSNILAQAAQSMLTQTNQQPQGILALLQ